jgi:hypothetical protein
MSRSPTASVRLPVEQARQKMNLLLLGNSNYFGNVPESGLQPVLNIAGDTNYEDLGCVGFSAALSRLEAIVSIKQNSGYNGGLCTTGSQEYVRFYLSFDSGATWQDQGVVSFSVYDLPGPKPLEYSVALPVTLTQYLCLFENLPQVRAILSWNYPPPAATPGFVPVWGNVVNAAIQVPSTGFIVLGDLFTQAKLQLPADLAPLVDVSQPVPVTAGKALTSQQLTEIYKGKPVPTHRIFYPQVEMLSAAKSSAAKSSLAALNLDLGDIIGKIIALSGDTSFEQLDCVGLDVNRSALAAVVNLSQPYGYNGGLCTAGSTEYVAFWVNWGSGFEYAGTTSFNAHDLGKIPKGGLDYAVGLAVDVASHMQPCADGPQTATIRAILSWETAPPPTNPNYVPAWGNSLDALAQIPAGQPFVSGTPDISIIGGIGVAWIDTTGATANPGMTRPNALFAFDGSAADPWIASRQCPFGGQIIVQGQPTLGSTYSVWVQKKGAPSSIQLTEPVLVTDTSGNSSLHHPDPSGFFKYLPPSQNQDNILAYWDSSDDDLYYVWLEIANSSYIVSGSTPLYLIQLDNTLPAAAIHIDNGGDCKQFDLDSTINGHFVATDLHFGAFSLWTTPTSLMPPPNEPVTATPSTSPTAPAPGNPWSLNTGEPPTDMIPCGYVVELEVWDNAIVNSVPGEHNGNSADVGFCLITGS